MEKLVTVRSSHLINMRQYYMSSIVKQTEEAKIRHLNIYTPNMFIV